MATSKRKPVAKSEETSIAVHKLEDFLFYTSEYQKRLPDFIHGSGSAEALLKVAVAAREDLDVAIGELQRVIEDPTYSGLLAVCTPPEIARAKLARRRAVLAEADDCRRPEPAGRSEATQPEGVPAQPDADVKFLRSKGDSRNGMK